MSFDFIFSTLWLREDKLIRLIESSLLRFLASSFGGFFRRSESQRVVSPVPLSDILLRFTCLMLLKRRHKWQRGKSQRMERKLVRSSFVSGLELKGGKHGEHPWRCWEETNESVEGKGRVIFIKTMVMSLTAVRGKIKFYLLSEKFRLQANSA